MSSAEVEPLDAARSTNPFEPAIETDGCSSKAKQSPSTGHVSTVYDATITNTTPDELFDSVGGGLDAAAGLASDPLVITSEKDDLYDKELHTKPNEEQENASTITIENNQETEIDAKEYVGQKQPDPVSLPKSILKNQTTTEPTFKIESQLQTSNETLSEDKEQSYEDIMSSAYASPTPSQAPITPSLHKSLDVISTIHEHEPLTDNTEPLQGTPTTSSASQGVSPTVDSAMPQPHEAEATAREDHPSEQMQGGHAVKVDPQPEVAAEVTSGNLSAPISILTAEPSSNTDSPSASGGDSGLSKENDTIKGELDAQVANENSVALAKQAKKNGHDECDGKPQPEATVAEPTERSPADTAPAPFLDETIVHTNETAIMPSSPSTEILRPNEAGNTEAAKEAPESATVAHGDVVVLEAAPGSGHDSAGDQYGDKNHAKTEEPADVTPTPVSNETTGHYETDAPLPSHQEPAEGPHDTLIAVPTADAAKVGSTEDPSTGDQDSVLPLSAETTVAATSNNETGELKEEVLPVLVDVENSPSAPRYQEPAMKEPGQAAPSKQEEWNTSSAPVYEAQAHSATDTQDLAPAGPAEGIPAQSVELAPAASDPQESTKDPIVPSLPLVDRPEATNGHLDLAGAPTATSLPEGLVVNVQTETEEHELGGIPKEDGDEFARPVSNAKQEEVVEWTKGASFDSQLTDAVPVNEPSLPLPTSEHVEEPKPAADPAATAKSKEPILITGSEEPPAPMTPQEDACAQPEDKVEVTNVEAAQTAEDWQTGGPDLVEKTIKEIPPTGTDQSDAPAPTPHAEESAQEPLIGLHQDKQPTESADEVAQPYNPAPTAGGPNESQIDAFFQEPQTTPVLEDNKADGGFSPGSPLFESSVAMVDNLGVKEHSGSPLVDEPQERGYIEGTSGYDPTAIVNAPNIEPHGVSVAGSMPAPGGVIQDEHDVTWGLQLESLDVLANEHTGAVNGSIGPPTVLNDELDGLNLDGSNKIFEPPKTVDTLSEAPALLPVEGIQPPKGVEAYDQDKGPEVAIDDSEVASGPQTEMAQERPTDKVESIASAQADGQDTPTDSNRKDISPKEVIPNDHPTIRPTEDIAHVATMECPAEEPTHSVGQDGQPNGHPKLTTDESVVQDTVSGATETREAIVDPISEVTPAEPDKIVFKSGDPIELNDRQSAETSKDESPATNGEDSVAKPLKEAEELPSVTPTSTSVMDPMKGIEFDHGFSGVTEDVTPKPKPLHDANLSEEMRNANKSPVERPSKEQATEPALGEALSVDVVLASGTCDESTTKEGAVPDLANEGPQSTEVQSFQRPSDVPNNLQPPQVVEGVGEVKLNGNSISEQEALSTPEPSKDAPPVPPTSESVAAGATVEDTTTIEDSVEPLIVATTGDINANVRGYPEHALQGAGTGQVRGDGQEERAPVFESESKVSVAPAEAISSEASDLKSESQVIPVVDTVEEVDEGSTTISKGKNYNFEDPVPRTLEGLVDDEVPQEIGGLAIPASDGLHIHSGQDNLTIEALQCAGSSPKSPAGVIGVPDADHNICVDEFSLKGETLRPASHKQIQGEAPQNTVLDQQSEVPKDSGKVEAPPFPADKLDGSCPPEETVSCLGLPALNESKASAPTELTGRGYGRPFESMSVIHSDGQRAQAPETSTMLGSGEPALHHIVSPAEYTIGKDKYQPVLEEATQKERPATPPEALDTMGSLISQRPFESHATTEHEVESQPSPGVVRGPMVHGALAPVFSNDHTILDHRFIVDSSSPEQGVQDHHPQETNGTPLNIEGIDSKDSSAIEAVLSAAPDLQDTQGVGQGFSVPPADNYPSTDRRRPSEEGASIGTEAGEVSRVGPGPVVENTSESSIHGTVKRSEQGRSSTIDTSGGENLARQTKELAFFAADDAQPQDDPSTTATKPGLFAEEQTEDTLLDDSLKHDQVHGGVVEQDRIETTQPNTIVTTNDQTLLPTVEGRVEQSVPDIISTPSVPLTVATTTTIPDTVQGDAPTECTMVGDQGEDGSAPSGRDITIGAGIASTPCGQAAEPSHEVEATTSSVLDVKLIDEPIPSGEESLSEINTEVVVTEDDVDRTRVADDGETATTVVLPDPPMTDPARSGTETIELAKLDIKPPHSEQIFETLYLSLLSPEEVHEQQISYLVGELPKVAVMVPPSGPQTINQEIEIEEEKEAEQAAEKIEAERDEIERSIAYDVEPNAVESVTQGVGVSQSTEILDEPPNLGVQEHAAQDTGIEQLAEKAASEVSVDDTILDEPAPTETSDGEPIEIATEADEFEDLQEILKLSASAHEETDLALSLADSSLVADDSTPLAALNVTCPPPTEAAITTRVSKDGEYNMSEQNSSDLDITPGAEGNKPPVAVHMDLEPSPSADPTIEGAKVVENVTSSNDVVVGRMEGVVEELAAREEAEKAVSGAAGKARIEQEVHEAEKGEERQAQLKLDEEDETERAKVGEAERVELEASELLHQMGLAEKHTLVEEEAQKLRDTEIAKLEAEAALLEAELKVLEQARLLAKEKELEEASDCPVAPSTPRSELSSITSGFDSPSQISLASHMATAPDSPRIAPEDPTPFVELPESDLILQNRSPKSINSSIAGEPPETPLGSLPNTSLLANDVTPPARTFSQTGRPTSFKLGSPLHLSTENVEGNNSTENAASSHSKYDPPPVLVPKLSITPAKMYSASKPEAVLPALSDMGFPWKVGVEDLPAVVEDEDADVLPRPEPRRRHLSTISNFSVSHRMPGGWTHSGTVAEGRASLDFAEGEFSPVPRTPRPSAVEPESDGERGSRCVIM